MRKSAETYEEEKERVVRRVTRGRYTRRTVRAEGDLAGFEKELKQDRKSVV